jgi:hypothetical protein
MLWRQPLVCRTPVRSTQERRNELWNILHPRYLHDGDQGLSVEYILPALGEETFATFAIEGSTWSEDRAVTEATLI